MKKIRTTIGALALVVSTTGCTWNQLAFWNQRMAEVAATPDPADDVLLMEQINAIPPEPDTACHEWFWFAIEAGWTMDQWPFLSQTMWAESRCDPNAHNPSGARGLMQEMPFWAERCGITVEMLYDPIENLKCAKVTFHFQGKNAWDGWNGRS